MTFPDPLGVATKYIDLCCSDDNPDYKYEKFKDMLCDDVDLHHISNLSINILKGKDLVARIYKEKLFDVTQNFVRKSLHAERTQEFMALFELVVDETKNSGGESERWHVQDRSFIGIRNVEGVWKISQIHTKSSLRKLS